MIHINYNANDTYVIVVGANSEIGQALCLRLLDSYATVFGLDIQKKSEVSITDKYHYFMVNPLNETEMVGVVESIQTKTVHIDSLVNLSGTIDSFKSIEEITLEEWSNTYDISFKSCFNSCKTFLPLLKNQSRASIVNMSSGLAFGGQKNYGAYTTAKNAVISFSRTLATEVAPTIRVNTVAPGAVDTNFLYQKDGAMRFDKEVYKKLVPLGTIGEPEEISSVILFLLSDGASHITGQCIHVNGGAFMN